MTTKINIIADNGSIKAHGENAFLAF